MEETRRVNFNVLLGVLAVVAVAATIWAATALGAGGSSSSDSPASDAPAAAYVQDESEPPAGEDCPERDGDSGGATSSDL